MYGADVIFFVPGSLDQEDLCLRKFFLYLDLMKRLALDYDDETMRVLGGVCTF